MSHYIDKFTIERSGNFVRLVVGGHALGLEQEEARRVAAALEQANKDELVFGGETGEHVVLRVETAATGDRWISVEVRTPLLEVQAEMVAKALKEEAANIR